MRRSRNGRYDRPRAAAASDFKPRQRNARQWRPMAVGRFIESNNANALSASTPGKVCPMSSK